MRLDPNPLFRRVISPWYDSAPARWATLISMIVIAIFSITGIWVSRRNADFNAYTWMPLLLLLLSMAVAISIANRMIRKSYDRNSPDHG